MRIRTRLLMTALAMTVTMPALAIDSYPFECVGQAQEGEGTSIIFAVTGSAVSDPDAKPEGGVRQDFVESVKGTAQAYVFDGFETLVNGNLNFVGALYSGMPTPGSALQLKPAEGDPAAASVERIYLLKHVNGTKSVTIQVKSGEETKSFKGTCSVLFN